MGTAVVERRMVVRIVVGTAVIEGRTVVGTVVGMVVGTVVIEG